MAKRLIDFYEEEKEEVTKEPEIPPEEPVHYAPSYREERPKKAPSGVWSFLRPILIFAISLAIVSVGVYQIYRYVKESYFDPVSTYDTTPITVTIPRGASLSTISEILLENGLIQEKQVFKLYADLTDNSPLLKAGTYELNKTMTFDEIIYTLRKGVSSSGTANVTLLEGLTAIDFSNELVKMQVQESADDYLKIAETGEGANISNIDLVNVVQANKEAETKRIFALEGYLFPDTYEFYTFTEPQTVIERQLARFNEILSNNNFGVRAEEIGMSLDDAIKLASIIEKEAQVHDFKKVSAVLHNRLAREMPLQCDSTISYALGIKNRINLTDEELNTSSPYNTHIQAGLPVGPICNPGKDAIEAALYPDQEYLDEEYLYFALMSPDLDEEGKLYLAFSKDIDAHNEIVSQYREAWQAKDQQTEAQQ